jgi:hypothetical protein
VDHVHSSNGSARRSTGLAVWARLCISAEFPRILAGAPFLHFNS